MIIIFIYKIDRLCYLECVFNDVLLVCLIASPFMTLPDSTTKGAHCPSSTNADMAVDGVSLNTPPKVPLRLLRVAFFVLGCVFFALGMLGVVTPGLPTTVFVLMAGYCWSKSSERLHRWLMRHRLFGKMIRDWQTRRAMPRRAKYLAWGMMAASNVWFFYALPSDKRWLFYVVAGLCLAAGLWMARLPDA